MTRPKYRYRYRQAQTGRFVSKAYALEHPDVVVKERIKK